MSTFETKVVRIEVEPHPSADRLEIGRVAGYQFVVGKGQYQTGDLGVYIPEGAILPDAMITEMGLEGKLAGGTYAEDGTRKLNRVKAMRLRGVLSQGLFYSGSGDTVFQPSQEGCDLAADLGITKWEPPIPIEMAGQVEAAPGGSIFRTYTDIENIKSFPTVLHDGEMVRMTEKLHGSCTLVGIINGQRVVSSKGIAARHLCLKESASNVYWRIAQQLELFDKLRDLMDALGSPEMLLFGEVLGVQDLRYGVPQGQLGYRAFDIHLRRHYSGIVEWMPADEFSAYCELVGIPTVPTLYEGPFSRTKMLELTSGQSTLANHLREGVVIRTIPERDDDRIGRVVLKSVSGDYLTRKGGTEME